MCYAATANKLRQIAVVSANSKQVLFHSGDWRLGQPTRSGPCRGNWQFASECASKFQAIDRPKHQNSADEVLRYLRWVMRNSCHTETRWIGRGGTGSCLEQPRSLPSLSSLSSLSSLYRGDLVIHHAQQALPLQVRALDSAWFLPNPLIPVQSSRPLSFASRGQFPHALYAPLWPVPTFYECKQGTRKKATSRYLSWHGNHVTVGITVTTTCNNIVVNMLGNSERRAASWFFSNIPLWGTGQLPAKHTLL